VEFVYQPVKIGTDAGGTYLEVHRDVYDLVGSLSATARSELARRKLSGAVDRGVLRSATEDMDGVPVRVSPEVAAHLDETAEPVILSLEPHQPPGPLLGRPAGPAT